MKRLIQCDYRDLHTGESWTRLFWFDALTGERLDPAVKEIEDAPLPDPDRSLRGGQ